MNHDFMDFIPLAMRETSLDFFRGLTAIGDQYAKGGHENPDKERGAASIAVNFAWVMDKIAEWGKASYACSEGCSYCCQQPVGVSPTEAILIAVAIQRSASGPQEVADLTILLRTAAQQSEEIEDPHHYRALHLPCVFLHENRCTIYPGRPLSCRSYAALDVRECLEAVDDVTKGVTNDMMAISAAGLFLACEKMAAVERNIPFRIMDLPSAILIALETPNIAERYMSGEDVFWAAKDALVRPEAPKKKTTKPNEGI
jgi:Fe-S-cluster containining protein